MAANATKKTIDLEHRPALDEEEKRQMLVVLIRNAEAFELAQEMLTVKQMAKWSAPMTLVWKTVRKFYQRYAELPGQSQLITELKVDDNTNQLMENEEREEINEFLDYAFDDKEHGKKLRKHRQPVQVALDTCRKFLEENLANDLRAKVIKDGGVNINIPKMLEDARTQWEQVQSLTSADIDVPFPENWDVRTDHQLMTTGSDALDVFFGGGLWDGEVVIFMGPYGSCKTTLACHCVSNQLKYAAAMYAEERARVDKDGDQMVPMVVLIFTESDKNEYRDRLLSNMAKVPRKRLTAMRSLDDLDNSDEPGATEETRYELKVFKKEIENGRPWRNEHQRVRAATALANKHLLLLDCTDSDESTNHIGAGGIPQLAGIIKSVIRKRTNCYPIVFWLDHVSGLVDRMGDTINDDKELHKVLTNIPRQAGDRLGKPFKAPVMLLHQFSGASQSKSVVAKFHHNEAEGSKSIAKYAVFAVTAGPVDAGGMCKWEVTKHRREPASKYRIVQVNGRFNRITDKTHSHGVNDGQRCIMKKSEMETVTSRPRAGRNNAEFAPVENL